MPKPVVSQKLRSRQAIAGIAGKKLRKKIKHRIAKLEHRKVWDGGAPGVRIVADEQSEHDYAAGKQVASKIVNVEFDHFRSLETMSSAPSRDIPIVMRKGYRLAETDNLNSPVSEIVVHHHALQAQVAMDYSRAMKCSNHGK
jgi:hypothetical protein